MFSGLFGCIETKKGSCSRSTEGNDKIFWRGFWYQSWSQKVCADQELEIKSLPIKRYTFLFAKNAFDFQRTLPFESLGRSEIGGNFSNRPSRWGNHVKNPPERQDRADT